MRDKIAQLDRNELAEVIQEIANTDADIITVCWKGGRHEVFMPKRDKDLQLTLDGMEMPKVTEFTNEGE